MGRSPTVRGIHEPIHPGQVLLEEFLNPTGITQYRLARTISVPARRIHEIVHGARAITPDTALRLSRALGTSDRFWMNLQSRYDLDVAMQQHRDEFDRITPLKPAPAAQVGYRRAFVDDSAAKARLCPS